MRALRTIHAASVRIAPQSANILACVIVGAFLAMHQVMQSGAIAG
jgi:hypothetical protein